jgi:hypothetical protein
MSWAWIRENDLVGALAYMTKGVDPACAATLGIAEIEATGAVMGKRAAWWQQMV